MTAPIGPEVVVPAKITAATVKEAVARKFCAPEYATFFEVANGTGARGDRYADALAMGLFPSRGLLLHGFEVKVSRSDWLNELKDPHKSDAIQRYCDRWWIVTPPDIVRLGELPDRWGHYVLKGSGLHCEVKAPQLDRADWKPEFLAAVLRRAQESAARDINAAVQKRIAQGERARRAEMEREVTRQVREAASRNGAAAKSLALLKDECGIEEREYGYFDDKAFAQAVGFVHELGISGTYGGLETVRNQARLFADKFDALRSRAPSRSTHLGQSGEGR